MRLLNRTNQTLSAFLALVIVFLVMSITIYAWFSLTFSADGDLKFSTGAQNNPLRLYIVRELPNGDRKFDECTPGAVITPGDYPDKRPNPFGMTEFIKGDESNPAGTTVKITEDGVIEFTEITIGLVDNLGEPKPENIIYLRLEIPAEHGTNLNFALSYLEETGEDGSVSHMNLYTMTEQTAPDGTKTYKIDKVTDADKVKAMKAIEVSTDETGALVTNSFLEYQYAISTVKYEADQMGNLNFLDDTEKDRGIGMFDHNYIDTDTSPPVVPKGKFISESVSGVGEDATYYLYIKITPNLEAFALAFDHLPAGTCFMDFNIRARFEATDVADGSGDGNTGN